MKTRHDWMVVGYVQGRRVERCRSCPVERTARTSTRGEYPRSLPAQWLFRCSPAEEFAAIRMPLHQVGA